jgi:hypothetical protein
MFTDRSGKVVKRFTVRMTGSWKGDEGTLDEHFVYSDGSTQQRVWHLRHLGDGRYSGRADDVVGEAQGQSAGNAIHWSYVLALPVNGRVWNVSMDDWMYLIDGRTLLNRTAMSKLGLHRCDTCHRQGVMIMSLLCARLNPPLRDWQGRSAWILGASSGIGRATADALHRQEPG